MVEIWNSVVPSENTFLDRVLIENLFWTYPQQFEPVQKKLDASKIILDLFKDKSIVKNRIC